MSSVAQKPSVFEGELAPWDLKEPLCLSQARLMVASPEFVYQQLKFYGEHVGMWEGKEELEKVLLRRNDKLINLALGQFATHKSVIQELYNNASADAPEVSQEDYNLGLRVACLSNRHFGFLNWPDFGLNALMARGLSPETQALLINPTIPSGVLEALFKKSDSFAVVDEKNWLWMIQTAARNERLNIDNASMDGPDMGLWGIQKAIFGFLETVPVTSHSAFAALDVLNQLDTQHTTWPDDIAHVLERWGKAELKDYKDQEREGYFTHLPLKEELRCLLAARYSRRSTSAKGPRVFGSPNDEDIARRCAFYAGDDLSEKDIEAGFKKDADVFLFAVLKNPYVLSYAKKRALIEGQLSGSFINEYQRMCERLGKENKHFEVSPVTEAGRDLLEEFQQPSSKEMSWLEKISAQNERLSARLRSYERKAFWIVLILIVAMYIIVKR
jgi:hypothetical protein